jgi:hypothetical protein
MSKAVASSSTFQSERPTLRAPDMRSAWVKPRKLSPPLKWPSPLSQAEIGGLEKPGDRLDLIARTRQGSEDFAARPRCHEHLLERAVRGNRLRRSSGDIMPNYFGQHVGT